MLPWVALLVNILPHIQSYQNLLNISRHGSIIQGERHFPLVYSDVLPRIFLTALIKICCLDIEWRNVENAAQSGSMRCEVLSGLIITKISLYAFHTCLSILSTLGVHTIYIVKYYLFPIIIHSLCCPHHKGITIKIKIMILIIITINILPIL